MPTKLLTHLRLLQPYSLSPAMKLVNPSLQSSHSIPVFCRIFPFKLKYHALLAPQPATQLGLRTLSTHPFRRRTETTTRLEPSTRVSSSSKSLIEDEAELSDWVGELGTDSFRGRLTSDEENDDDNRGRGGGVRKIRGGNKESNRIRDRDSYSFSRKRNRESDSGEDGLGGRGRRSSGYDANSRRSAMPRGRFRGEMDEGEGNYSTRKFEKGKMSPLMGRREGREFQSRGGRGRGNARTLSRNAGAMSRYEEDEDGNEEEDERMKSIGSLSDLISEESSEDAEDESDDGDMFLKRSENALFGSERRDSTQKAESISGGKSDSYLSETRFDQCSISPLSLKGIKDAGYEKMTVVQEATLPVILKGKDVLAKAKTGTGKTVAFLLPSIEVVLNSPAAGRDQKRPPIHVLVICPTRELAIQAAGEANTLLKYHPSIGVQVVIGGTRLALEQKRMQANPCQILVATPGRLRDHMENTAGFATRLMGVKVLVLDEADHLLDMGFRKDIEKIIGAVPKQRQTLLFSATVPEDVRQICHIALKRDHEFINTVEEGSEETHSQVTQMHLVAPLEKHFSLLYVLLKEHIADDVDYKILVFCTTAMVTKLVADLLGELNLNVREIHSRKSQSYRTRVSDEFRKSKGLILVTSDVSARGVDYPDVTLVVQVGLPADREQYIHRLGRTGRKGKEGQGILLLAPWEEFFLSSIKGLPITKAPVPSVDPDTAKKVQKALSLVERKSKEAAYQAWLGYYNSDRKIGKDKYRLVELANEFSRCMGLDTPPSLPKIVIGKMGLNNVPGLRYK